MTRFVSVRWRGSRRAITKSYGGRPGSTPPEPGCDNARDLPMRGPIASVLFALVWGAAGTVWAQAPAPVRVSRGADARDCPDEDGLEKLIAAVRGRATAASATAY